MALPSQLQEEDRVLLQRAIQRVDNANAIVAFLSDYFRDKYGLTPANEITPNGQIITIPTLDGTENISLQIRKS
jgi:hypothetical protein